jgi:chitodextrinase
MAGDQKKPSNSRKTLIRHKSSDWLKHSSRIGLIMFAVVFATIGGYILLKGSFAATPAAPSVYLTPSSKTFPINTTFSVQVRENSGTTNVNAVQANFSYPSTLLQFVSIDTTGTAFTTTAPSSGGNGSVNIAQGVIGGVTGDQLIATVTFKTLTTGGTASLSFISGTVLLSSSTNTDILGSLSATAGASFLIDTIPPSVSITAPQNGVVIAQGSTASITASATDNDSVVSVDIYIDGTKVTSITNSPYTYSWNTSGVSLGTHTIQAKATDPSGNIGSSSTESVSITDQTPPVVSISSPANGALLKGTNVIAAAASDNTGGSGMSKVEFYVDGVLKGTDTTSPYSYSWDTTTATDGSHSLTAKAYDIAGNSATSSTVSVNIDNTPPTTPGGLTATANTFTSISLAWNSSTDNNGVTAYRLSRNGTVITTTSASTLTYTDTGLAASTSYTYTVVALDAAGNVSAPASLTTSTQIAKVGDLNGDNLVNITDLSILLSDWNTSNPVADINHDGIVNIIDLSILLSNWGT